MDQIFTCVLLLLSFSAASSKYVYIKKNYDWHEAQKFCRTFYTDLAPVNSERDMRKLLRLTSYSDDFIWIGLHRNATDPTKWMWSGGGQVTRFFWDRGQPQNQRLEDYGLITTWYTWHDGPALSAKPFFCYRAVVVRERKTWEEALDYCREHHRDLASVASETEMLLIQKELSKNLTTDQVWIGLHFFPDQWLWVDRQPLHYEAWAEEEAPVCPEFKMECAALQVPGGMPSGNSTVSSLVSNATAGVVSMTDKQTDQGTDLLQPEPDIFGGSHVEPSVKPSQWKAYECEQRLHFICY